MNNFLKQQLNQLKIFPEPELELRILLNKNSLKKNEIFLSNFCISDINLSSFKKTLKRRINREPISKIFGQKSFWKYDFVVDKNVIDPRPESELIIEKVIKYYPKKNQKYKILDICTGSGCLAISLAKEYKNSKIVATDISSKALNIAKINAKKMKCANQIKFIKCNLINNYSSYDIIVSNPPYLSLNEYKKSSLEIKLFEPKIAFVAKNNGYEFYKKISLILSKILKSESTAFVEIGSSQAKNAIKIFKLNNLNLLEVSQDLQKLDRILILNKT